MSSRSKVSRPVATYRREVQATPAAKRAKAQARRVATRENRLRLVNHRRPFELLPRLPRAQLAQLTRLTRQNQAGKPSRLVEHEDWAPMELVDVLDVPTGTVTHQLYVWPWGSGELFVHDTTTRAGVIIQHRFMQEHVDDLPFRRALAAAYATARPALAETIDFDLEPGPSAVETARAAELQLARTYADLVKVLGASDERYRDFDALTARQQKAIRTAFRTVVVEELAARGLAALGLPPAVRLRSWCGHSPPTVLERRAGRWPVWKWLKAAIAGSITSDEAITTIVATVTPDEILTLAGKACTAFYDYDLWGRDLDARRAGAPLTRQEARVARLLGALVDAAGEDAATQLARVASQPSDASPDLLAAVASFANGGARARRTKQRPPRTRA